VVDDEPSIRELLVDALSGEDLEVSTAGSGHEAIAKASNWKPDLLVTDLLLGDCTGLDVIDSLTETTSESIPAVVITGQNDPTWLSEASRRRPIEMITKPLDLERLRGAIRNGLADQAVYEASCIRHKRLRKLARAANDKRRDMERKLNETCVDLTEAYRTLSGRLSMQEIVLAYQNDLIAAQTDDDVFRALFRTYVRRSGPVFGISMVCDSNANLRVVGRFGVPHPDSLDFCQELAQPMVESVLNQPEMILVDATDNREMFDASIRKYLVGLNVLAVPLIPSPGELIGVVVFYRKGEQPFTDFDQNLAELMATPTAVAVRRND
jgi:CheY-like chemotaxis protein